MPDELTHASFFSGVGGTDLGLESAGWRTVSFSEIDPYANAVLAERWPGVPNLGDIVGLSGSLLEPGGTKLRGVRPADAGQEERDGRGDWRHATLWSGGFPCQDLSVAGKRAGFGHDVRRDRRDSHDGKSAADGASGQRNGRQPASDSDDGDRTYATRSSLAFSFLDLVERHRPPAVLLENVPGLLSSHRGRDMATLLGRLAELGYGVAYRILDARHFGVPQRRRRVFILGLRCGPDDPDGRVAAERAAEVLSVGSRCDRHPPTGEPKGPNAAHGVGAGISRALSTSQERIDADTESFVVRETPDADRVRAADGLAGRAHDRGVVGKTLRAQPNDPHAEDQVDYIVNNAERSAVLSLGEGDITADLLPLGLDSHRYRVCGNGVVSFVAEWIGVRLRDALQGQEL